MALKASKKDLVTNFVYSFGAAIVIIGAMFKINHWELGPLTGTVLLAAGLTTEALIFMWAAFDPPHAEYDWENAYPELADTSFIAKPKKTIEAPEIKKAEITLSDKLDKMLADAKLDTALFERLKSGIDNFGSSVDNINKTVNAASATQQYGDQLSLAANHMESLNALYQVQLEHGKQHVEFNRKLITDLAQSTEDSKKFASEMNGLSANLTNLNKVYGGMLTAMKVN